jgi:glycerophosphoryl diester phosphodiesterase
VSIFHLKHPHPKHEENSLRGIRKAARRGFDEIDLDLQMTKDGAIVVTHWPRPMIRDGFRDPAGKLRRTRTVASMTLAEVTRLRTKHGGYRIQPLRAALAQCARSGIGARLEPKGDRRFENEALWVGVKREADALGAKVRGYSIRNLGGRGAGVRRVRAMNAAGIKSKVIHR